MTRPTNTPLPRFNRPEVEITQGSKERLEVYAPLNVQAAPSSAELLANSLNVALNVAEPIVKDHIQKETERQTLAGMLAANGGSIDEKQVAKSKAYAYGVKVTQLRAEVAQFQNDFEEVALKSDVGKMDVEQFSAFTSRTLQERFSDLMNDEAARVVAPELLDWQQKRVAAFGKAKIEAMSDQVVDDVGVILSTKAANGELDAEEIRAAHASLYLTLGGTRSNEAITKLIGELSVAQGDPSIIDRLPKTLKYSESEAEVPGVTSVPRLARALEQYRREAESVQESKLGEIAKAKSRAAEQALFGSAARGHDITEEVTAAVEAGTMTVDAGRTMLNFSEAQRNERDRGFSDPRAVADLENRIVSGEFDADPSAVMNLRSQIGAGQTGNAETVRLYGLAVRTRDAEERLSATDKLYRDVVRRSLEPARNLATGQPEPAGVLRQSRALIEFTDKLAEGGEAAGVAQEILKRHGLSLDASADASPTQAKADPYGFIVGSIYRRGGAVYRYIGSNKFQRIDSADAVGVPVIDAN